MGKLWKIRGAAFPPPGAAVDSIHAGPNQYVQFGVGYRIGTASELAHSFHHKVLTAQSFIGIFATDTSVQYHAFWSNDIHLEHVS